MRIDYHRRRSRAPLVISALILVIGAGAGAAYATLRVGEVPAVTIEPSLPAIGPSTPVAITVREPKRGLSTIVVELVQADRKFELAKKNYEPQPAHAPWEALTASSSIALVIGHRTVEGLVEGPATIRVTAGVAPTWLLRPEPTVVERTLPVRLRPPTLEVTSTNVFAAQGGAEAVVYKVGETAVVHGVRAGDWWFRGYPLPGGPADARFVIFGVPYDLDDPNKIKVVAQDEVGNEVALAFIDQFTPKPFREDTIEVSARFMERVVPAILARTPEIRERGTLLESWLLINRDLRKQNAETLKALVERSRPAFLWTKPFLQMESQVMSSFADRRTYVHEGQIVDRQDHLGYDLAATKQSPIPSANSGVVLLARYFGIYGNSVVVDHGFGLMSLYSHLSEITVKEGQEIDRGTVVGKTGATGLAGGDHLHFTTLIQGLPVNPIEWWDGHWIHDRIALKLGEAFPFSEG